MKKLIAATLALLMILALTACDLGIGSESGKETGTAGTTDVNAGTTDAGADTDAEKQTENQGGTTSVKTVDDWLKARGVTLPTNVHYEYKLSFSTIKIWKLGDELIVKRMGDTSYYRFENGHWKEWLEDGGEWYYQDYGDEFPAPPIADFRDYQLNLKGEITYYTATGESEEICGKTCAIYYEKLLGTIWVYEDAGIVFRYMMDGAESAMNDMQVWEEGITEFPVEKPQV